MIDRHGPCADEPQPHCEDPEGHQPEDPETGALPPQNIREDPHRVGWEFDVVMLLLMIVVIGVVSMMGYGAKKGDGGV